MNYGTRVELAEGIDWTSESHANRSVRYFNGRRFIVIENRNFMTAESGKRTLYWQHFTRYVALQPEFFGAHRTFSYSGRSVWTTGPSIVGRALAAMVPDDNQSVPF